MQVSALEMIQTRFAGGSFKNKGTKQQESVDKSLPNFQFSFPHIIASKLCILSICSHQKYRTEAQTEKPNSCDISRAVSSPSVA